jgi:ubiquinol-cytochrome c reductase cytochrome c subunit
MKADMQKRCVVAVFVIAGMGLGVRVGAEAPAQAPSPAPAAAAQGAPATPPGNAANGRKNFVSFGCYQCHGYEAQGSTATGPRLGPRPLAFAALSKYVRHPTNQMPPFTAKVLSDAELADIYAFLRSLPPAPDADTIPLLK